MASSRALYARCLRLARTWPVAEEAEYIRVEARKLFEKNARLTDAKAIEEAQFEASSRIDLAKHYGTPYPRLYHVDPLATPTLEDSEEGAKAGIKKQSSKAAYMSSYY
eukprot:PLAT5151.1.p1 GENE.PLAT5151.1~~PLAT5151.1.p1  ORF type:complete len:119 (-),score=8.79 PLAT5151.1:141-464(-)